MSMEEAVQQSLFEEANRLETARMTAEDMKRTEQERKAAFRVAFDFLEAHEPPQNTEAYWNKTCKDVGVVVDLNAGNELCMKLLAAVMDYLDERVKLG